MGRSNNPEKEKSGGNIVLFCTFLVVFAVIITSAFWEAHINREYELPTHPQEPCLTLEDAETIHLISGDEGCIIGCTIATTYLRDSSEEFNVTTNPFCIGMLVDCLSFCKERYDQ